MVTEIIFSLLLSEIRGIDSYLVLDKTKMSIGTGGNSLISKYKNYSFTDFVRTIKNDDINKCNSHHRLQIIS